MSKAIRIMVAISLKMTQIRLMNIRFPFIVEPLQGRH